MNRKTINNLVIFIVVVIASGWLGVLVDSFLPEQPKGDSLGMGIWLLVPNVTVVAIILLSRIGWREIGYRLGLKGNGKWYVTAILIFPVITTAVVLFGVIVKWIDLSAFDLKLFLWAFSSTLVINFVKNIFEETLWRGFLTSQLMKLRFSDWKIYLLVGSVWGIWHLPYYLAFLSEAEMQAVLPISRILFAVVSIVTMICWTVPFVELFRITGSVWPCVLLHMVEDSFVNPLVISGYISIAAGKEIWVSPIQGLIGSALYVVVGLGIRSVRKRREQAPVQHDKPIFTF